MKTAVLSQAHRGQAGAGVARFFSVLLIVSLGMETSCKDDDGDAEPAAETACRITKESSTSRVFIGTPEEYSYTSVFTYTYDDKGNQIENTIVNNNTYVDGKKSTSTSNTSMQYDADGFLLRSVQQSSSTDKDGIVNNAVYNHEYTYENGRLIKDAVTSTTNGTPSSYVSQYEYDSEGKVIKYSNTYNNSSVAITYSGKIIQKFTMTDGSGNVTSPFVQYNEKGWLTKSIETWAGGTDEFRYEYTSEGQIAKEERYINSKPSSGTIYEFDTKENPALYRYKQKGHPTLPSVRPNFIQIHNITRATYLESNADGTGFQPRGSSLYTYDYNAKGFPTNYSITTTLGGKVDGTLSVTTEYANCP